MFVCDFSAQEIHLYLLLNFPKLLFSEWPDDFAEENYQAASREQSAELEQDLPMKEWLEGIKTALKFREKDIKHFFSREFSLAEALALPLGWNYPDVQSFLEAADKLSEEEIRDAILQSIWPCARNFILFLSEEEQPLQRFEDFSELCRLYENPQSLWTAYLRQAGLSAESSWNILAILEEPKTYLYAYSALLNSFQFISEAIVGTRESEAVQNIQAFLKQLEEVYLDLSLKQAEQDYIGEQVENKEKIRVMPSVEPFAARLICKQNILVLGFALPSLLNYKEEAREAELLAISNFCQTLADPTRYKLCRLLLKSPVKQKDLARELEVSQATISHHLSKLKACGLVSEDRDAVLQVNAFRHYIDLVAEDFRIYG